ncbi:hypothetical protein FB639_002462 [Coemansia asiatica]|nr:hypothetical protein FB639_002462 [Coemansia asiatica]
MFRALRQRYSSSPAIVRFSSRHSTRHAAPYSTDKTAETTTDNKHGNKEPEINVKPDHRMKSRSRLEHIAVKQPSAALTRMSELIMDSQKPKDAGDTIEHFKFTTDDLLRDIVPLCAQKTKSMAAAEVYLATATSDQRLDLIHECRQMRVERIKQAFNAKQLQGYLRQNGQKTQGTKDVLVGRVIDKVWGITGRDFETRLAKASENKVSEGLELPLNQESWDQLQRIDKEFLETLERDFKVKIELIGDCQKVRASGDMHSVRGAMSALREGLAAYTAVEVDLARYGRPRKLSPKHLYRVASRVSQGSKATITSFEGELFVSGERSAALEAQNALVDALTEEDSSLFYALVPELISQSLLTTLVPATAMLSKPPSYILDSSLHVSGVSEFITPVAALSAHSLFSCVSGGETRLEDEKFLPTMARWLEQRQQNDRFKLSARLGRVLLDTDSEYEPLGTALHRPADLLRAIGQRSPLFGFVGLSSPLRWLSGSRDRAKTHLELVFRQVLEEDDATKKGAENRLPMCSTDKLVVRIPMQDAKVLFDEMQMDKVEALENLNIAVLGAESDLQITGGIYGQIECTAAHRQALRDFAQQLGLLSKGTTGSQMRRHETVRLEQPNGLFSLQDVVLDKVTTRGLLGGFAVDVHQTWNVVDDLRFSQVELRPETGAVADGQVERFLGLLLEAAFERPTMPVTKAAIFSIE